MSRTSRFMCFLCIVLLIINLISEVNGQTDNRKGPAENLGDLRAKGEKDEKGPLGKNKVDRSDYDRESVSDENRKPPERGSEAEAATSCQDAKLNRSRFESEENKVYIYGAQPFQVTCDKKDKAKTCLLKNNSKEFDGKVTYKFAEAGKPFWLSSVGFNLLGFYNDFQISYISQLKYLLKISNIVSIEIVVRCKNTVISKDSEKYLQIHLWDGQNVGPFSTLNSPAYYEIPDELNKCKDFPDETKWGTAIIRLTTYSNFIKDFYIRDIQREKNQEIYIELQKLCVY